MIEWYLQELSIKCLLQEHETEVSQRRFVSQKVRLMNNDLYNVLFKLLSQSDESDIRMVCSSLLGYLVGKGKISVDELDEYISVIKKD